MIKVKRSDVKAIVDLTFPEYKGRKFVVDAKESVGLHGLNWEGGSRSTYRAADVTNKRQMPLDCLSNPAPWNNKAEGQYIQLKRGCVVVEHRIFCGKDCGLKIYVHPEDMVPILPTK